jgi:hypothetical protein
VTNKQTSYIDTTNSTIIMVTLEMVVGFIYHQDVLIVSYSAHLVIIKITILDSQKIVHTIPFCLGRIRHPFWKISNNLMWHSIGKCHLIIHTCKINIFMCVHMLYYITHITYNGHNNLVICPYIYLNFYIVNLIVLEAQILKEGQANLLLSL